MSMAAGQLNRRFAVEKRDQTVDELNQPVLGAWVPQTTPQGAPLILWGSIKGPSGMASIRGSEAQQGVPRDLTVYSVRIRYRADDSITVGMRLVHLGMELDIKKLQHDFDRREWTDIVCEVGGSND